MGPGRDSMDLGGVMATLAEVACSSLFPLPIVLFCRCHLSLLASCVVPSLTSLLPIGSLIPMLSQFDRRPWLSSRDGFCLCPVSLSQSFPRTIGAILHPRRLVLARCRLLWSSFPLLPAILVPAADTVAVEVLAADTRAVRRMSPSTPS